MGKGIHPCRVCNSRTTQEIGKRLRLFVCDECAKNLISMHFTGLEFEVPGGPTIQAERLQVGIPGKAEVQVKQSLSIRDQLRLRDGDRCRYCYTAQPPLTLDHVIPKCQGGQGGIANLVLACKSCNLEKGGRTPEEAGMPLLEPYPEVAARSGEVVPEVRLSRKKLTEDEAWKRAETRRILERAGVLVPSRIECPRCFTRCQKDDLDREQGVCAACVQQRAVLVALDHHPPNGVLV